MERLEAEAECANCAFLSHFSPGRLPTTAFSRGALPPLRTPSLLGFETQQLF